MKYVSFFIIAFSFLVACSKNDDRQTINADTPAVLQNKTWSLDSSVTVTTNYTNTDIPATGQEQTIVFSSDTLVKSAGSYKVSYNSYYDGTNLYYSLPGSTDTRSTYWQIISVTDAMLVLKESPVSDKTITDYYHAK